MNSITHAAAVAVALLMLGASIGYAQVSPENSAVLAFQRAADDYVFLHRRLERRVEPVEVTANPETLEKMIEEMATAVSVARAEARQGDLFTPAVQDALRARVGRALRAHAHTSADTHAAELAEALDARGVLLKVNASFPWRVATAMRPCILAALPPLPPELEYRIVGGDLVLIDTHASLIVDLLPRVLPD